MSEIIERITTKGLTRRAFLAGSGVAMAALSLQACTPKLNQSSSEASKDASKDASKGGAKTPQVSLEDQGEWLVCACWWLCGGRCKNQVLVVDGVPVRQKSDDTHADSVDFPQQRGCIRGRTNRRHLLGADRLKYPMKRKHWEPFTGGDKSLRGRDEWVRISWDEALGYIAAEIKNAVEKYGNRSVVVTHIAENEVKRVMWALGGCTEVWDTGSPGAFQITPKFFGAGSSSTNSMNDRLDLLNVETFLIIGSNPAWSSPGNPMSNLQRAKDNGSKFIFVDPYYSDTAAALEGKWVPIRPVTDTAFLLAIAHTLIVEDDPATNPLIDWDFLSRCTVGFDADSMPEGESPDQNFKDYVLGTYDGQPKDIAWAEKICGVSEEDIRYIVKEIAAGKKVAILAGWAPARGYNVESFPHILHTIGCMTGHIGKPGEMCGVCCTVNATNGGPYLVSNGPDEMPPMKNPVDDTINTNELWDAFITGKYHWVNTRDNFKPLEMRDIDVHVFYAAAPYSVMPTYTGGHRGTEALRKIDFIVSHALFPQTTAIFSDIVLPVTSQWERVGGFGTLANANGQYYNREYMPYYSHIMDPVFESKDDSQIAYELAVKLGLDADEILPFDAKQVFFNRLKNAYVIADDGKTREPLATITQSDIDEWGVKGEPQQGRVTIQELKKNGGYQVKRTIGDNLGFIAYSAFVKDPEANPLATVTGKIEIFSPGLKKLYNETAVGDFLPIPAYKVLIDGYEATFSDWDKQIKGEFPLQRYTPHYMRRSHTVFDNVDVLREAWSGNIMLNPKDADAYGLKDGDAILITGSNGAQAVRTMITSNRVMPGVIWHPHGAWSEIDPVSGIDFGAGDGYLSRGVYSGVGVIGTNSQIAKIEKWTGEKQLRDVDRPSKPIEFVG